ncbi:MAG: LPS export ABC transporter periplasmic protein LptC [Pseudomonadota bacterium]
MRLRGSSLAPLLGLGALAAFSFWANEALQRPLATTTPRAVGADHSFSAPHARLFDSEGQLAYEARGTRLEHRAESGDYILEQADLTLHPRQDGPSGWHIRSERARFLADRTHAMLENMVEAERLGAPPESAMRLKARDVTLNLETHTAESTAPMSAEGQHWQSRADTFRADFTSQQLLQEGRVHDRHEPLRR